MTTFVPTFTLGTGSSGDEEPPGWGWYILLAILAAVLFSMALCNPGV